MQMASCSFEASTEIPIAIEVCNAAVLRIGQNEVNANQRSGQAHAWQVPGAYQFEKNDFIDGAVPVFLCPAAEVASANQSGFVIVGTVICRAGMGNVDRDHGNVCFA